jgi:hypothetical protein
MEQIIMSKQRLISAIPSKDAIKLANAVYQTYIVEEYSHLKLSIKRLCEVFQFDKTPETIAYFKLLFDELNEPVAVKDFAYEENFYKWLVLDFCSFEQEWQLEDEYIYVAINEIYLHAMQELMRDPFIEFKD